MVIAMATDWTPSLKKSCCVEFVSAATIVLLMSLAMNGVGADLVDRNCVHRITQSDLGVGYKICVGRAEIVEVGQNTSLLFVWSPEHQNLTNTIVLDVNLQFENIAEAPSEVAVTSGIITNLEITGISAGRTVVNFECDHEENRTNQRTCPFSKEVLFQLKREVSFVNYLLLDYAAKVVGWTYTIVWVLSYYPQKYYICRRQSVVGLNFNFVGMGFTSAVAYLLFNIGLYWIPEVQNEYFKKHPEGVNPVQLNDVLYSIHSLLSICVWIFQCMIYKRENQISWINCVGSLYIGSLWLVMLICVIMGSVRFLNWLEALYIISYVTLLIHVVKYIPVIWTNFRRKSTEGFSPYTTILSLIGGLFSVLQMFMIAYNYDDWESIFGDPTKFFYGLLTVGFELTHFVQHYIIYRKAWMKKYKLSIECNCDPGCCKCKVTVSRRRSSDKVCDFIVLPDKKLELKSVVYI